MKSWRTIFATEYWNIKLEKTLEVFVGILLACLNVAESRRRNLKGRNLNLHNPGPKNCDVLL